MAYGNIVEITGNVTRDPELRFAQSGVAIVQFGVAWNRKVNEVDEAHFFDVVAFRELAENVSQSITKGMRVVVAGRLQHRTWETDEGKRSKVEIVADEICPSLRWASASVTRNERNDGGGGGRSKGDPGPQPDAAPQRQRQTSQASSDDEPF